MKSKKSLSSNSSWLFADLCFFADKHSESPDHTSACCCWMSWDWTENASLPPWRRRSCSPTSIASCWTKRNEKGWKSTETSVTDLIKPLQLPRWQTDHYCQHKMKRDDRPETRPWGILAGESGRGWGGVITHWSAATFFYIFNYQLKKPGGQKMDHTDTERRVD